MKTIADFKRKMVPGSKWEFRSNWCPDSVERTCTHSQSNAFALEHPRLEGKSSWCDWPKKAEVQFINGGVKIVHPAGWLFYRPLEEAENDGSKLCLPGV